MDYWDRIIYEVKHRYDKSIPKYFVHFPEMEHEDYYRNNSTRSIKPCRYYMQLPSTTIYFTLREFQCAMLLMRGLTYKAIANELSLSSRTVECYVQKMKEKLKCANKYELCQFIAQVRFSEVRRC